MKHSMQKIRCASCLRWYSLKRPSCPHCGYAAADGFAPSYTSALPLCTIIEPFRLGRAIEIGADRITYIALDTRRNKRLLVEEFFPHGYVQRQENGSLYLVDPSYREILEDKKQAFLHGAKHTLSDYGTVYRYRGLRGERLPRRSAKNELPLFATAYRSIPGSRSQQEDAAALWQYSQGVCAVLCDGMGGLPYGEIASQECVRLLQADRTVQYCEEDILPAVLQRQVNQVDRTMAAWEDDDGQKLFCGTTLIFAVLRREHLYFASVGDSHLYLLHDHSLRLLTEEHNYLAELLKEVQCGTLDKTEALCHPQKDALTSYIGKGELPKLQITETPVILEKGDLLLLCSDGLYRTLSEEEILQLLIQSPSVEDAADALIGAVENRALPHQDNTTLLLIQNIRKTIGRKRK